MADIPFPRRSTEPVNRPLGQYVSLAGLVANWRAKAATSRTLSVLKVVVPIWLVSRLLYVILTYAAVLLTLGAAHHNEAFAPQTLLTMWQRWDANWYLSVAGGGYENSSIRAAFFPLYPGLTAALTAVIGPTQRLAAGMIVASLGALAACIGLGLLAEHEYPHLSSSPEKQLTPPNSAATAPPTTAPTAAAAVRVMLAYPLALFMFAAYADSLLIACCAFAIYFARCRRWLWAAVFAFTAGLTRPTAVILVLPLLFEFGAAYGLWQLLLHAQWREVRCRLRPRLLGTWLLVTAAAPLAMALYAVYLWHLFGDPLLFMHLQSTAWHRSLLSPWQVAKLAAATWRHAIPWGFEHARMLVDELPVVLFAVLTFFIARRLPLTYTLLMLGILFTSVATPVVHGEFPFVAAGRYLLPALPVYLLLGSWMQRRPWLDQLIVGGGMALQAILLVFFFNGGLLV